MHLVCWACHCTACILQQLQGPLPETYYHVAPQRDSIRNPDKIRGIGVPDTNRRLFSDYRETLCSFVLQHHTLLAFVDLVSCHQGCFHAFNKVSHLSIIAHAGF